MQNNLNAECKHTAGMTFCKLFIKEGIYFDMDVKTLVYRLKQGVGDSVRKGRLCLVCKPMQDA